MDMLTFSNLLLTKQCWKTLIDLFVSFLGNYGWAIILFTVALKLVLLPLDIIQRRVSKKNTEMQAIVQPEIQALQKKYPNDKDKINQGTMAIYKKHNYNVVGSCVVLLINLVVTLVVFFTLFQSLNYISRDKLTSQYAQLQTVYETAVEGEKENAVLAEYEKIKDENGWLWIKNVWKSDTKTSIMLSFDEYYKQSGLKLNDEEKEIAKAEYQRIEEIIYSADANKGPNGYYVLVILAGVVTFLSQWLTTRLMKPKNADPKAQDPTKTTNLTMLIVMPIVMVIFAWTSTSIFSLYLITNSLMTCLTGLLTNLIFKNKNTPNGTSKQPKKAKVQVVEYSRNYFKGE